MRALILAALTAALVPTAAFAGTQTATFQVTTTVTNNCQIVPANITLGAYDPTNSTALSGTANISVTCTKGANATLKFSNDNGSGQVQVMKGQNNGGTLNYHLYSNSAMTTDATGANLTVPTGTGTAQIIPIWAQVAAGQNVAADNYSDTVTATVTF